MDNKLMDYLEKIKGFRLLIRDERGFYLTKLFPPKSYWVDEDLLEFNFDRTKTDSLFLLSFIENDTTLFIAYINGKDSEILIKTSFVKLERERDTITCVFKVLLYTDLTC